MDKVTFEAWRVKYKARMKLKRETLKKVFHGGGGGCDRTRFEVAFPKNFFSEFSQNVFSIFYFFYLSIIITFVL